MCWPLHLDYPISSPPLIAESRRMDWRIVFHYKKSMSTSDPGCLLHLLNEGAKGWAVDLSDHLLRIHPTVQEDNAATVSSAKSTPYNN
ncbi:hypothetical protein O181_069889 [Austropuccinia psidii MF-1]|uniref:Uncharacterized protein n=1 Tax=Austropuccinia psidii MF-1 TaxID=1389203 RepID=A0A9Q3EZQ7_9BASI|nr:hypothetical protein [Austropuccinia psidii MF-1]